MKHLPRSLHALKPTLMSALLALLLAGGCATQPALPPPAALLHDEWFAAAPQRFDARSLFALSPEMQAYAQARLPQPHAVGDHRQALLDALYAGQELRLSYDGASTRTAAEAFAARAGNCLSLVIMTAAFAKHLDIPVSYRSVRVDELYTRTGDLTLASGHVNLVLAPQPARGLRAGGDSYSLTVDFLPQSELRGQQSDPLEERTIVAMYLNNRAAEALAQGGLDDAYGWARDALLADPRYTAAANTLGVIYQRAGRVEAAEAALRRAVAGEPRHTAALSNLVGLLKRTGRPAEAAVLEARLHALQPVPPFQHYERGRQAMAEGRWAAARDLFMRELRLQPLQDEVHFWAAQAWLKLGDTQKADYHLAQARDNSLTQGNQARYSAKLAHLRAHTLQ